MADSMITRFESPYDQYRHLNGAMVEIVRECTEADGFDEECLPAFIVTVVETGEQFQALPEELNESPFVASVCARWAALRPDED